MRINSATTCAGAVLPGARAATGRRSCFGIAIFALFLGVFSGCERGPQVVVYTSVDQEFARKILADFERQTGLRVAAVYDSEAGKTTGFLRRLQREQAAPRCDVWWSSEVFGTIELARAGVLASYHSPAAADIPPGWRDPAGRWAGVAARCRVLVHPTAGAGARLPENWRELAQRVREQRLVIANPLFGTTRGHVAAMFAYWGADPARAFLRSLREAETPLADGNAQCVALVAGGAADWGLTDTDDVWVAQQRGQAVAAAYLPLDQGLPPVWIPCTAALVQGGPNPAGGRRLIDFLLSPETERALAGSDSRNVPVRPALRGELRVQGPAPEPLDFERIAAELPAAGAAVTDILVH